MEYRMAEGQESKRRADKHAKSKPGDKRGKHGHR
jgi:hypothetical protein